MPSVDLEKAARISWENVLKPKHSGPCPLDDGRKAWVWSAACACAYRSDTISPEQAIEFIWDALPAGYGGMTYGKVAKKVYEAYGKQGNFTPADGKEAPKTSDFPKPDVAATMATVDRYDGINLNSFRNSMHNQAGDYDQYEVVARLFYPNALVCTGASFFEPEIQSVELLRKQELSTMEFIVPNPMSKRSGKNKDGKDSIRCRDTVGDRRWMVIEFDFEAEKDGNPTIWAEAIAQWHGMGMTPKDASARLLQYMADRFGREVAMIVDSGNKSIHGWFWMRDETESVQREFMTEAARMGADKMLYRPEQWVRFPGGTREDGRRQPVVYFRPDLIDRYKTQNPVDKDGALSDSNDEETNETNTQGDPDNQTDNDDNMTNETNHNGAERQDNNTPFIPLSYILEDSRKMEEYTCKDGNKFMTPVNKEWIERWKGHPRFAELVVARSLNVKGDETGKFFEAFRRGMGAVVEFVHSSPPDIESMADMFESDIPDLPELVKGIVRQGEKMVIGGPSKARKTWIMMNLAISIATGYSWVGFDTVQGKVLYVNFELHRASFKRRTLQIARAKGVNEKLLGQNLDALNLRVGQSFTASAVADTLISLARRKKYSAIFIDPTYKMLGELKENESGDIAQMLAQLERVAVKLGAAVIFAAHFPKGDMNKRASIDRIGGSGTFARDPDCIITMSPLSQKEVKQIGKGKDDKGKDDLCEEAKQILALLEKPMRHGEWLTQVKGIGLDKNKLNYESGKLQEKGLVDKNEEKLYYRTADGDAVVEAFKAKIAAGGPEEEEAPSNEAEEVQPPEQEIYKLEFTLRDNAPQKPIAVRFGDWRKGDFVHHRVSVNLQNFEDGEGEGQEGRPAGRIPVPCSVTHQGKSIVATCPKSGLKQSSYCETKARPGSALKRCLVLLDQQCQSCGEDYIHVDSNELETEDGLEQDV